MGKQFKSKTVGVVSLLLLAVLIVGVVWLTITPQRYTQSGTCAWGSGTAVKSDLHKIFLACGAYWSDEGSSKECSLDIVKRKEYGGFIPISMKGCNPSTELVLQGSGTEKTFKAIGSVSIKELNYFSSYEINAKGNIRNIETSFGKKGK